MADSKGRKKKGTVLVPGDNKPPVQRVPMADGDKAAFMGETVERVVIVSVAPDGKVTARELVADVADFEGADLGVTRASNESLMGEGLLPWDKALIRIARGVKKELVG